MLAIVNVSPEGTPYTGTNHYEVRVNQKVIATFDHDRQYGAAAHCLRDAADAIENCEASSQEEMLKALETLINWKKSL